MDVGTANIRGLFCKLWGKQYTSRILSVLINSLPLSCENSIFSFLFANFSIQRLTLWKSLVPLSNLAMRLVKAVCVVAWVLVYLVLHADPAPSDYKKIKTNEKNKRRIALYFVFLFNGNLPVYSLILNHYLI